MIYSSLWTLLLVFGFQVNLANRGLLAGVLDTAALLGLTLLFEPLLLTLFGTTPGKAVLGLYVRDADGGRLRYRAAVIRTKKVLEYGLGYKVPVYGLYRLWKNYKICTSTGES